MYRALCGCFCSSSASCPCTLPSCRSRARSVSQSQLLMQPVQRNIGHAYGIHKSTLLRSSRDLRAHLEQHG